jgi:thioredoxin-dependent peroxiredoxin
MLKEGDKAPDFSAMADDGSTVSLGDYSGKNLILYFYPKANTPGCIHEANAFRNDIQKYEALNTKIVGVSADTVESQTKFKDKHSLNFPLLADTEFKVISAYDARRMKSFLGKTYMGIVRMTFWIDPGGKIKKVWNNVTPKGHGAEVLAALNEG